MSKKTTAKERLAWAQEFAKLDDIHIFNDRAKELDALMTENGVHLHKENGGYLFTDKTGMKKFIRVSYSQNKTKCYTPTISEDAYKFVCDMNKAIKFGNLKNAEALFDKARRMNDNPFTKYDMAMIEKEIAKMHQFKKDCSVWGKTTNGAPVLVVETHHEDITEATPEAPKDSAIDTLAAVAETCGLGFKQTKLCVWIDGNTKPHKEELKTLGMRWSKKRKAWYYRLPQAA